MIQKNSRENAEISAAKHDETDCIITAAGLSSRMGQWKLMLPYRQGTILDASIENALSFCQRVILVVGFRGDELKQRYSQRRDIKIVDNPDYQSGLFSSVRCGVLYAQSQYVFVSHGDLPCLTRDIYSLLWRRRGPYALLPCYRQISGHPVLLAQQALCRIAAAEAQQSMKALLLQGEHRLLAVDRPEILIDVDTPENYRRLISK